MTKQDEHPIRNGIIVTVAGGLILACLLNLIPSVWSFTRSVLAKLFSFVTSLAVTVWQHLISTVEIPWLVLYILAVLALFTVWKVVKPLVMRRKKSPRLEDYREDTLYGVTWRWSDLRGTNPRDLAAFCPRCETRLVHRYRSRKTALYCGRCACEWVELDGDPDFAISTVERQIERRINTDEWKTAVERVDRQEAKD